MKITVINEQDIIVSKWAGGESRQYFIYPPDSNYAARDFLFRVSMAISNLDDEAKYSDLENYTRYLLMLEGVAHVFHKDHHEILMNPYVEVDVFDGGWESSACGKVTDFNLMTNKNCTGSMSVINESQVIKIDDYECKNKNWLIYFCGEGIAFFDLPLGENISISKNELIVFEDIGPNFKINVQLKNSRLIQMFVKY